MKRISLAIFSVAILAVLSLAQIPSGTAAQPQTSTPQTQQIPAPAAQPQPANATQPTASATTDAPRIAPGSVIPVKLTKTVDAKKAKTGDEVVANVTQDMKSGSGDLILPKDTKIVGHVTEAQARNKEQKESQMGIAFDKAVTKDGPVNLPMSIQAVIVFQNPNPAGGDQDSGGSSGPSGASASPSSSARSPMSGATQPPQQPSVPSSATDTQAQGTKNGMPQINGNTQGVIGIPNLTLSTGPNGEQGSVMTSEKNNVKLESGTVLLLKVNQ
jgi:hypothetical protein